MIKLYSIGFSGKSAEEFFKLLLENKVKKLIDIRLNNKSQLAGFTNVKHFPYFLKLHNIEYDYMPILAPTKELLDNYKNKKIDWNDYENIFNDLLEKRNIKSLEVDKFNNCVFLCSEKTADKCHRRLVLEFLKKFNKDTKITIKHL